MHTFIYSKTKCTLLFISRFTNITKAVKLSVKLLEKIAAKHDPGEIVDEFHALYSSENGRDLFEHRRQLRAAVVEHKHTNDISVD